MYPSAPASGARPTTVSLSAYLLFATAALSLLGALISLTGISTISDVYKAAYEGTAAEGTESVVVIASVGALVVNILFSAGLAILAIFNNRGRQGSRITTWALGGVILCCSGIGLAGTAATNALDTTNSAGGPNPRVVQERLDAALPSWYGPITTTLSVLMLLALLASLILLALPASNAYFQAVKAMRQGGWDPSMPYPVYPGQQPYPGQPYPGQPYPGQLAPGQQPYPGQPAPGQQQPYPAQPAPGQQPYPGQPAPGRQPYPGQQSPGYGQPGAGEPHTPLPGQPLSPSSGYGQPGYGEPHTPAPGQPMTPPPGYGQPHTPAPAQPQKLSPPPGKGQPGAGEPHTPAPGQPLPPPPGYGPPGGERSSGEQFGGSTPLPPGGQQPGNSDESPHTGSIPPADPWDQRPGDEDKPTTQGG